MGLVDDLGGHSYQRRGHAVSNSGSVAALAVVQSRTCQALTDIRMGAGASAVGSGLDERLASALGTATAVTTPAALEAAFQSFSNQLRQQQLVEETEPDFTLDVVASDSELGELAVAYSSKMGTAVGASPTSFTYAINADCTANFSVLVSAIGKCCEATSNSPLKLNVSSSSFSEDAMEDLTATNVISLCIGNTAVRDFASVSMGLNVKKLLSLDLSFSESLELTAGSFILLSNLRRLNLDGCGITSTSSEKCLVDCISSGSSDTRPKPKPNPNPPPPMQ